MGYIEKLLYVRLGALLLMGALSATTTGLAGKCEYTMASLTIQLVLLTCKQLSSN
jgi:hypothetical protein